MLSVLFSLFMTLSQAQEPWHVTFCEVAPGQGKTDLIWVETRVRGNESTYQGIIKASHRSFGFLAADINQIEWVFKDVTVPTAALEDSWAYRMVLRESGWTLDEYKDEYHRSFVLTCHESLLP